MQNLKYQLNFKQSHLEQRAFVPKVLFRKGKDILFYLKNSIL